MSSPVSPASSTNGHSSTAIGSRSPLPPQSRRGKGGPQPVDIYVGKMIRARRAVLGLSQSDLGKILGVAFQQVQKYEKGGNRVSASRLVDIADALATPVSNFFPDRAQSAPEPLELIDSAAAMRLLRAFNGVRSGRRRAAIVALVETMCAPGDKQ